MSYSDEVLADSPAAYYRCQEASGNIQDSSGNARHATSNHGTLTYSQAGPIATDATSKSILFNTGGFTVPQSAGIDFGDTFTLEAWVNRASATANLWVFDRGGNGVDGGYRLFFRNDNPDKIVLSQATVADTFTSTPSYDDTGTWWHVVATKDGANIACYVNGSEIAGTESNTTYDNFADDLEIGDNYIPDGATHAYLTELALYPTALSSTRVAAHYAAAFGSPPTLYVVRSNLRY